MQLSCINLSFGQDDESRGDSGGVVGHALGYTLAAELRWLQLWSGW